MREAILRISDSGGSRELDVGDIVSVQLEENPSTGYAWELAQLSGGALDLIGSSDVPSAGELLGAPRLKQFRFAAVATGTAILELRLRRPWEAVEQAQRRFRFTVKVPPTAAEPNNQLSSGGV